MGYFETVTCTFVILYVVYKIADHLIRIPRIENYKERYILITGCGAGFGKATAQRLDKLGCNVFAGCRTETGETELRKVCSERLHTVSLDVARPESVRKAFEYVLSKLPPGKGLWGILNNAGISNRFGSPDWISLEDYKNQCDVNLWGLVDVTLTFLPLVKIAKGRIVNVSSMGGRISFDKALPYSISKYGVEAFTDGIRRTVHHFGCKACIIEAGAFATNIVMRLPEIAAITWKKAPPAIQTEYGEEYAKHVLEKEVVNVCKSSSRDIGKVVDAYEHALLGRYPRARYVIGLDANYLFIPIQWLPEWLGDWVLRCLNSGAPLPIAVKK